jgi:TonB family protein
VPGGLQDENFQRVQDVSKELDNAPETAVQFNNKSSGPVTITEASMKAIPNYATFKKQGENWGQSNKIYAVRVKVTLTNTTNRAIKGIALDFRTDDDNHSMYFENLKPLIEPFATHTFMPKRYYNIAADPTTLTARVVGVLFADGEGWGKVPPPPPPPPPPPGAEPPTVDAPPTAPDPPLPPEESRVIRKSGGLTGSALYRTNPAYPEEAKAAKISGAVVVEVKIDEQGKVVGARALSGHPLLRDAALEAARQWVFQPTTLEGQPVKVIGTITFNFAF